MLITIAHIFILLLIFIFPQRTFADWPMFRNNHSHSGGSQYEINKQPNLIWSTQNIGDPQGNLIVGPQGNIYASTSTQGLIAIGQDGNQKWRFSKTPPTGLVFDSEGNLYFSVAGSNPFIYSLNKNGEKLWEYNLRLPGSTSGQYSPSGPIAISKDKKTLYTGIRFPSQTIIAFNLNGTVKWHAQLSAQNPNGSVTIADSGNLYIGTGGNGRLISLDANGIQRWSKTVGSGFTVYVQTPLLDENENVYVTTSGVGGGELLASYNSAGVKRWQYKITNSTFAGSPAYKNGLVIIVERTSLSAINASDGTLKWKWNTQLPSNRTLTSPAVDNQGNVVISGANTLYILNSEGQVRWSIPVADALDSPIISDNNVIYTHQSLGSAGSVYKLGDTTPTPTPKTPLILIPGIGGSELKVNEDTIWNKDDGHGGVFNKAYSKDEKVWVNEGEAVKAGDDDYFDVLRMKPDGINSEANIGLTNNLYAGAYQGTIDFFTSNGYTLNQDFFVFPYDWRKDISSTKDLLDQKISQIKTQTGVQKVDIIAHSMGGLVARNYIADATRAQNVRKLFTLGTPHLGTPEFLKNLRYGSCLTKPELQNLPYCIGLTNSEIQDVLQNMISGYQLSPSQLYFNFYSAEDNSHPYPYRTNSGPLNYLQIKGLLNSKAHNISLYSQSEFFHTIDNSLSNTNGVDVTIIAGSGIPTLGQIIELSFTSLNGNKITINDKLDINGDGTVTLLSSSIKDPHKDLFLNGSANVYYTNQEHGDLVFEGPALNLVKFILEGNTNLPSEVSEAPYKMTGHALSVHSPINIHVYDINNNHTGPTSHGDFEANIPGSSYDTLGDAKFIFLPDNRNYTIKFEATDNGSFDFKIRKFENDDNTETILYNDIPLTNTTKAETEFDTTSSQPPVLQIDNNGDGNFEASASATATLTGDENYDQTPPNTDANLSGKEGLNGWYTSDVLVKLKAEDASGSGVLKTEYILNNGQDVKIYNQPFAVSSEGTTRLKFRSIDKAGNEENVKEIEIKIDKTAPEAFVKFNPENKKLEINNLSASSSALTIQDPAGNISKLIFDIKDKTRHQILKLKGISYNLGGPAPLPKNRFDIRFTIEKITGAIKTLSQFIRIKGLETISARYSIKKDTTRIVVKKTGEKKTILEKSGLFLLELLTNKGKLETSY